MKEWLFKALARLFKKAAPELVAFLLAQVNPSQLADMLRPSLRALMNKMGPDWQIQFVTAFQKITKLLEELLADKSVGT